jgi:aspartate-semialdehyde dehydrogenase
MTHGRSPRIAVVGATGMVGRTMIRVLRERGHAPGELRLLASGRSGGTELEVDGDRFPIAEATIEALVDIDIALFSAGADVSIELAPKAAAAGTTVIDNSSAWRMDPGVPLVVSQVNPADLETHEGIVANPNCSTMQLAPILMALRDAVGLERVIVDTYQSVSGTGAQAVAELEAQIEAHVDGRPKTATVYPHPIAFNALPEIDVFRPDGYTQEEWKVVAESRKILHLPDLAISCTAVRVPVFVGHSEAVHVETRDPISPEEARRLFGAVPGVVVRDDPPTHAYPLATDAEGTDEILVGRIRRDASLPGGRGLALWVVADNLRVGAATNAVALAELLIDRAWVPARSRRAAGTTTPAPAAVG